MFWLDHIREFRASNSDFGYFLRGQFTVGYTPPVWDLFLTPDIDTQVQGILVLHLIQMTRQSK
jgi:hypothetical protein